MFDLAYTALLDDLQQRGMLDNTLVVAMGEFGRTPQLNARGGRDHWPGVWSVLFAGGGVRGGQVIGASDRIGAEPRDRPVDARRGRGHGLPGAGHRPGDDAAGPEGRPLPLVEAAAGGGAVPRVGILTVRLRLSDSSSKSGSSLIVSDLYSCIRHRHLTPISRRASRCSTPPGSCSRRSGRRGRAPRRRGTARARACSACVRESTSSSATPPAVTSAFPKPSVPVTGSAQPLDALHQPAAVRLAQGRGLAVGGMSGQRQQRLAQPPRQVRGQDAGELLLARRQRLACAGTRPASGSGTAGSKSSSRHQRRAAAGGR